MDMVNDLIARRQDSIFVSYFILYGYGQELFPRDYTVRNGFPHWLGFPSTGEIDPVLHDVSLDRNCPISNQDLLARSLQCLIHYVCHAAAAWYLHVKDRN